METLDAKIISVVVYPDRAQVKKSAAIELTAGEHILIFDNLPDTIDNKSIQVNGEGNATLANVKFKKTINEVFSDEEQGKLYHQKVGLEDELKQLDRKAKRLEQQKKLLEDLAQKVTSPTEQTPVEMLQTDNWLKIINFYQERQAQIDKEIWDNDLVIRELRDKLRQLNFSLESHSKQKQSIKNQVWVVVQTNAATHLTLYLQYVVGNASWQPLYDLRVFTETKKMSISYHAHIQQNTGENWEDVSLQLSTARPNISANQPSLNPWHISLWQPKSDYWPGKATGSVVAGMPAATLDLVGAVMEEYDEKPTDGDFKKIQINTAQVETKTTSVFFNIAGKHLVKSDRQDHKVSILIEDFDAYFQYSTVPKLSPFAYLRAKVSNHTHYPFLAGETNIFLDNNYVASGSIKTVAPTEEFWTSLGVDEGIKVEHKFLKKYEKKEGGIFTKKTKVMIYEYQIILKNFKKTVEEIKVKDQLPISSNEGLKVQLIEPVFKENTDRLEKNEYEYLEWSYQLKAGEEVIIPFKFSVEYAQDTQVVGLD
jgi:uncharacterized protein (TIGR02231 family)